MKIVESDNHNGDYPNERFVNLPWIRNKEDAQTIADAINSVFCRSDSSSRYWRIVEDDYTLQPGFEP